MDDLRESAIKSEHKYRGRIVNVRVDEVELPSGIRAYREVVEHPGAVAVVGLNDEGNLILVKQFRHPAGEALIEIPAGKLKPKEAPEECAQRELLEETGYRAGRLQLLTSLYTSPGFCNEVIHIYLAYKLQYEGNLNSDDGALEKEEDDDKENLQVIHIGLQEALEMTYAGRITDAKTVVAILLLKKHC